MRMAALSLTTLLLMACGGGENGYMSELAGMYEVSRNASNESGCDEAGLVEGAVPYFVLRPNSELGTRGLAFETCSGPETSTCTDWGLMVFFFFGGTWQFGAATSNGGDGYCQLDLFEGELGHLL